MSEAAEKQRKAQPSHDGHLTFLPIVSPANRLRAREFFSSRTKIDRPRLKHSRFVVFRSFAFRGSVTRPSLRNPSSTKRPRPC